MADWDVKRAIGSNLESIRNELGLTQEQFATMLDTDQSTVSLWETGARLPRLEKLVERLENAKLDPSRLVPTTDAPPRTRPEPDPAIAAVTVAMRDLPPEVRQMLAQLVDTLRTTLPRDYDAESAELMRILARVDPVARGGILKGIRQTLSALGLE